MQVQQHYLLVDRARGVSCVSHPGGCSPAVTSNTTTSTTTGIIYYFEVYITGTNTVCRLTLVGAFGAVCCSFYLFLLGRTASVQFRFRGGLTGPVRVMSEYIVVIRADYICLVDVGSFATNSYTHTTPR